MEKCLPCETEGGAKHDGEKHRGGSPPIVGHEVAGQIADGEGEGDEIDEGRG